jgi:hypothetical protein
MYKKLAIIIAILTILSIGGYFVYRYRIFYYPPKGTGAAPSEINNIEIQEGMAINNLIKSIPLQLDLFSIESYDYSKGKFRVVLNSQANTTPEVFSNWLLTSEYKSIPTKMFELVGSD